MVEKLVTYLEMAAPERLRPAAPVDGFALERVDDPAGVDAGRIRRLHDAIATPHHWSSLGRSDEAWQRYLGEPRFPHLIVERRLATFSASVDYVARERGARLLEVSSGRRAERDAAHRFYPAVGFEDASATAVRYRKQLGPPADVRPGNGRPRPCGPA